ncbi:hypothetical protein MNBD_NITROSPINAE02-693 [hydrothermal vent metagenome]|uniref:Uncharacterized protein n=1 Tax=hydrothermal vent metagenome TaxID=652676 RepID=A0A3B1CSQ1_9ZZZZ
MLNAPKAFYCWVKLKSTTSTGGNNPIKHKKALPLAPHTNLAFNIAKNSI